MVKFTDRIFDYWSQGNPHWMDPSKQQGSQKVMVWCGLWKAHVLGSFFFDEHVTGETYLNMLRHKLNYKACFGIRKHAAPVDELMIAEALTHKAHIKADEGQYQKAENILLHEYKNQREKVKFELSRHCQYIKIV